MSNKNSNSNQNLLEMNVDEMSKEQLLVLKVELQNQLKLVNGMLKDVSYEGYVSMSGFAERLDYKLSSMRSRYEILCVRHNITWTKFEGDKGYYFLDEDVEKVVAEVTAKRLKRASK